MKKILLFIGLANIMLANSSEFGLGLNLEHKTDNNLLFKYTPEAKLKFWGGGDVTHKLLVEYSNFSAEANISHYKSLNSAGVVLGAKLDRQDYEIKNNFKYDYNFLEKGDMTFSDRLEAKYNKNDWEFSAGIVAEYTRRNNEKKEFRKQIENKKKIEKDHIRLHFAKDSLGTDKEIQEKERGLWYWGYVEEPKGKKNTYPTDKTKFDLKTKDDYGLYMDIKKKTERPCADDENECKAEKLGFIVVDGSENKQGQEKYSGTNNIEIEKVKDRNEKWIKLEGEADPKKWTLYDYDPNYASHKNEYYKELHSLKKEYWENEDKEDTDKNKPIKKEAIKHKLNELDRKVSDIIHYGVKAGVKYNGIENTTLSVDAAINKSVFPFAKYSSLYAIVVFDAKYDYKVDQLTLTPEIAADVSFEDIKITNMKTIVLKPKVSAKYDINDNFNINAKLELNIDFNNENAKKEMKYYRTIVKPSVTLGYRW